MALKKSELYSSLWQSCDELRGGMDASQYKDYVLVLLFIKYVSDKYAGQPYAPITIPAGASSGEEDRFLLLGLSTRLRTLVVAHCYRKADDVIRIISARRATRKERDIYSRR